MTGRMAGVNWSSHIPVKEAAVPPFKNALFFRTLNGAQVGDLFMSLIYTCQLCGVTSFEYQIELRRHAQELAIRPVEWMP